MHKQLEKYLLQIEKQLAELSTEQREEELREIRSHSEMMIEENVARGCEAADAVTKALEQFGVANKIGCELKRTRINRDQRARMLLAGLIVFAIWVYPDFCMSYLFPSMRHFFLTPRASYIKTAFVFLISGWVAEAIAPKKALFPILIPFFIEWAFAILACIVTVVVSIAIGSSVEPLYLTYQLLTTAVLPLAFLGAWIRRQQVEHRQQPQITAD